MFHPTFEDLLIFRNDLTSDRDRFGHLTVPSDGHIIQLLIISRKQNLRGNINGTLVTWSYCAAVFTSDCSL